MPPPCGYDIYRYSECVVAAVASFANTLLIYLVLFHTPKELRVYSRVLLLGCLVDFMLITSSFVLEAHTTIHGGVFMFVFNGFVETHDTETAFYLVLVYLFTLYLMVVWVTVPFVYRYFLICRNKVLNNCQLSLQVSVALLGGLAVSFSSYFCYHDPIEGLLLRKPSVFEALPCIHKAQVPLFSTKMTLRSATPFIVVAVNVTYNYAIISWCSINIWRALSKPTAQASAKTQSLSCQMNRMLVVQAIGPLIVVVAPLSMLLVVIYLEKQDAPELMLVCSVLSWVTLLNPLSTLYFVKAYRYKVIELVSRKSKRVSDDTSSRPDNDTTGANRLSSNDA